MRLRTSLVVLVLIGCGTSPSSSAPPAPAVNEEDAGPPPSPPAADPTGWRPTGSLHTARLAHSANLLPDGSVIVIGGEDAVREMIASTEIFDPATESWADAEPLTAPRSNHAAVTLTDGRILVAGGGRSAPIGQPSSREVMGSALLFDPATKHFSTTGTLGTPRSHFGAVRLSNGDVLVAGGGASTSKTECNGVPDCGPLADPLASAEIYDVASGTFRAAAAMKVPRYSFTLTLLGDGRVVAAGGVTFKGSTLASTSSIEIYDPASDAWTDGPEMPSPDREHHSAVLLDNGSVMLVGGKQANVGMIRRVDLWSPSEGNWTSGTKLSGPRTVPSLVRLQSTRVLAVGGYDQPNQESVAEAVIFGEAGTWTKIGALADGRTTHSATLLHDGSVLVVGGIVQSTGKAARSCEVTTVE